jgi:hypothetical protein
MGAAFITAQDDDRFGSVSTLQRLLPAQQERVRSPLDQSAFCEAGDVAAGDDPVVREPGWGEPGSVHEWRKDAPRCGESFWSVASFQARTSSFSRIEGGRCSAGRVARY